MTFALTAALFPLGLPLSHEAKAASIKTAKRSGKWSERSTWGGALPKEGERVRIPGGKNVVLNTDPPRLGGLTVDGTLRFARKKVSLKSDWIMVHGKFRIGTKKKPFKQRAVVTLTGTNKNVDIMGMGNKVLGVMGGRLEVFGRPVRGWSKLASTAPSGTSTIQVAGKVPWRRGDRIVIASSSYSNRQHEERVIVAKDGSRLELDRPLEYEHWGRLQSYGGKTLDERAEVGLLTRNVVIRGDEASADDGFGAHMMVHHGSVARLDGVEMTNVGQKKRLRRYPVHFHMGGDGSASYIKRSSIHHSFNRCVVVHGTNRVTVANNVCYDHVGHGYFLEDGAERRNRFIGNLGLGTRKIDDGLLPSDRKAATFWITNPDNVFRNNSAAGSDHFGFWYALPAKPTGLSSHVNLYPRRTPLREFTGNIAHSNGQSGLHIDHGPRPDGNTETTWYEPVSNPADPGSTPVPAVFRNLTAYMNRGHGIWSRGEDHVFTGSRLGDNRSAATFASEESFLRNSLVVGESANKGTRESWEANGPNGHAIPQPWDASRAIIGFEFYDGLVGTSDTVFAGFETNSLRGAGALGYQAPNAFGIHPKNYAEGARFIDANPVYFTPTTAGMDGDASKVFVDRDGSVTGTPGATVVADNPFLLNNTCTFRAAWKAHVCVSDYVSLMVGTRSGASSAIKPVVLTKSNGAAQSLHGCCNDSKDAWTTAAPARTYDVAFNGGTPDKFRFVMWRGKGRWIEVRVPVPTAPQVTKWGSALKSVQGPTALSSSAGSAYYYDSGSGQLHIKISGAGSDWEEIKVDL